jgi:hypothetical protein
LGLFLFFARQRGGRHASGSEMKFGRNDCELERPAPFRRIALRFDPATVEFGGQRVDLGNDQAFAGLDLPLVRIFWKRLGDRHVL